MASEIFNNILKQAKEHHSSLGNIPESDKSKSQNNDKNMSAEIMPDQNQMQDQNQTQMQDQNQSQLQNQDQLQAEAVSADSKKSEIDADDKSSSMADEEVKKNIEEKPINAVNIKSDNAVNIKSDNAVNIKSDNAANIKPDNALLTEDFFKTRLDKANTIIKNRRIAAIGVGIIPLPIIDIALLTGIQLDTVRALAKLYDVDFIKDIGKTSILGLTGGLLPVATGPIVSSILKTVPVVGNIMGAMSMSIIAGASTHAVGQVFLQHFESGGTFLTFDPKKVRTYFEEQYEKGKELAKSDSEKKI